MKMINYAFIRAICALVAGIMLVLYPSEAGNYFVIIVGALFMVPSLISLIGYYAHRNVYPAYFPVGSVGGVFFGLMLMVIPGFFANFLTLVLGFLMLLGSIQQLSMLIAARHWSKVPLAFFIVPSLIFLAAVYAIANPDGTRSTAFIVLGITCILYAVFELINWFKFTRIRPKPEVIQDATKFDKNDLDIEDAQIVDDDGTA
ncbi:MAG: DUF308 domain-containing protein [Bacteroidaceae bacterium]|nr:DUF308 domain-containing protein [Bacteroidaceae bacterium]